MLPCLRARGHLYPRHELSPQHTPPDKQETPMKECPSAKGSQSHKWPLAWASKKLEAARWVLAAVQCLLSVGSWGLEAGEG